MELIYHAMETALPFSWISYTFMKNALLAVLLMTPLFGLLSTMVVSSRMAFFSDSLGHGAFTGIAVGTIVGRPRLFCHQHRKAAFLTRPKPGHALDQINRRLGIDRRGRGNQIIEDGQNGRQIIRTRRADDE